MLATRIVGGISGGSMFPVMAAALFYASWMPLVVYGALVLTAQASILIFAPLLPLSAADVRERRAGRRKEVFVLLAILGVLSFAGWLVGG